MAAKKLVWLSEYCYSRYEHDGFAKLVMSKQNLYLTMEDTCFNVFNNENELVEKISIPQNEKGLDTCDRIQLGLLILKKYNPQNKIEFVE